MKPQAKNQVFMYGSNLDSERRRSRTPGCNGQFKPAFLPNHELRFNKRLQKGGVAANVVPHQTRKVRGIIVELDDYHLEAMDRYEGHPYHYERKKKDLFYENGSQVSAYIYIAHPQRIIEEKLPSYEYLGYIIRGAKMCGLPLDYINAIEVLGQGLA